MYFYSGFLRLFTKENMRQTGKQEIEVINQSTFQQCKKILKIIKIIKFEFIIKGEKAKKVIVMVKKEIS